MSVLKIWDKGLENLHKILEIWAFTGRAINVDMRVHFLEIVALDKL